MGTSHGAALAVSALLLGATAGPATAGEDFTGFYAGVNAGYARGRDAGPAGLPPTVPGGAGATAEAGAALPPSAREAARVLTGERDATGADRRPRH